MANITFVYPDFESLGVEYLMALCTQAGHKVSYIFYEAEDTFLGRTNDELNFGQVADDVLRTDPQLVAFSCVTDNFRYQLNVAVAIKARSPNVVTIFGGIHPTSTPEQTLANYAVDAVAIGEAENSFLSFLAECRFSTNVSLPQTQIDGIIFKKDGKLLGEFKEGHLAELDQIPFPDKRQFLFKSGRQPQEYWIISSRGCPYSCSYCFNSYMHVIRKGVLIRRRSVANVIAELLEARKTLSFNYVLFLDDSFTTSKSWIRDFVPRYRSEIGLPFVCLANPAYLDEEIISLLAHGGCISVQMGIQSLSESLCRHSINRRSNNAKIEKAIRYLKAHNILVQVDHLLGIPGDTINNQEDAIAFYNRTRPNLISTFWLTYYPKTDIVAKGLEWQILTESQVELIMSGQRMTENSYLNGGSLQNPGPYYGVSFMLNWLPLLPKPLVSFLLKTRLYRRLGTKNYLLSTALPRAIRSVFDPRDFRGRSHIKRFFEKSRRKKLALGR